MEENTKSNAPVFEVMSEFGKISANLIGRQQPLMKRVTQDFFNSIIAKFREAKTTRFRMIASMVEFVDVRGNRARHPLSAQQFEYLIEDVLENGSEVVDSEFTITGRIDSNFHFDLKFRNNAKESGEVGCILVPFHDGEARFIFRFQPH
ncbi:hypothetical protein EHW66_06120 [Erwinia psidii]|uniref:hypothetical protein n=1 Tax=Erwinia psidii TaxID=69224 RepID=UPI00226B3F37|nr:hypothetical protein [Erwinia psidii]MCX8959655.1 hypothetical protein [Erwinia psidii]MCX8964599.1 hypothetical protein [Erwinia psidii]